MYYFLKQGNDYYYKQMLIYIFYKNHETFTYHSYETIFLAPRCMELFCANKNKTEPVYSRQSIFVFLGADWDEFRVKK